MKLASAIEGGLAGATTISLLGETLRKLDGNNSQQSIFDGKGLKKRFKKAKSAKKGKSTKEFIAMAGDLLGATALLGLTPFHKNKNVLLKGALLGAAAGLGSVLLSEQEKEKKKDFDHEGYPASMQAKDPLLSKAIEVGLFTVGGMIAAKLIQKAASPKKKKRKK